MHSFKLAGHHILVVEDEVILALDLVQNLESEGADVAYESCIADALTVLARDHFTGAIVDHCLSDGTSEALCRRLVALRVPFVLYSGDLARTEFDVPVIGKPSAHAKLIDALLIRMAIISASARA